MRYLHSFLESPEEGEFADKMFDDEREVAALVMAVYFFGVKLGSLGGPEKTSQAERIELFQPVEDAFEEWLDHKRSVKT